MLLLFFCLCVTCHHLLATGVFKTHVGTHLAQLSYFMGGGTEKFSNSPNATQQAQLIPPDSQAWGYPLPLKQLYQGRQSSPGKITA